MSTRTRPGTRKASSKTGPKRGYSRTGSFIPKSKSHKISNNGPVDPPRGGGDDYWGSGGGSGGGNGDDFILSYLALVVAFIGMVVGTIGTVDRMLEPTVGLLLAVFGWGAFSVAVGYIYKTWVLDK